jgi:hypothetical protein
MCPHQIFCRGTSDRVWRSATELRASLTNSDGGGIRTRDLPINSRSNPCLHHRQIFILDRCAPNRHAEISTTSFSCARGRRLGTQVGLPPHHAKSACWGPRPRRYAGFLVSSQRWKQGPKRGTIDPSVVVRRSRFETTALEMPAGFGVFTIAPILHAMGGRARTYGQAM